MSVSDSPSVSSSSVTVISILLQPDTQLLIVSSCSSNKAQSKTCNPDQFKKKIAGDFCGCRLEPPDPRVAVEPWQMKCRLVPQQRSAEEPRLVQLFRLFRAAQAHETASRLHQDKMSSRTTPLIQLIPTPSSPSPLKADL